MSLRKHGRAWARCSGIFILVKVQGFSNENATQLDTWLRVNYQKGILNIWAAPGPLPISVMPLLSPK